MTTKPFARAAFTLAAASIALAPLAAQDAQIIQAVAAAPAAAPGTFLPAGTQVPLKMSQKVTTKGDGWEEGDTFNLTTAVPIQLGDYTVIPQGTKAIGRITWLTSRGMFGKSGKMEIEVDYLELQGRRINLDGKFRQEGNGATLATVGAAIFSLGAAAVITGRSGEIPEGREIMAMLESDLPVALPEGASLAAKPIMATAATPVTASAPVAAATAGNGTGGDGAAKEAGNGQAAPKTIVLPNE